MVDGEKGWVGQLMWRSCGSAWTVITLLTHLPFPSLPLPLPSSFIPYTIVCSFRVSRVHIRWYTCILIYMFAIASSSRFLVLHFLLRVVHRRLTQFVVRSASQRRLCVRLMKERCYVSLRGKRVNRNPLFCMPTLIYV